MNRKIIRQGYEGCTFSLPIEWIRQNKLKPGDELDVTCHGKDILVRCKSSSQAKTKEIFLKRKDSFPMLRSIVSSLYKAGYDEILVHLAENIPLRRLHELTNSFTGLEIVSLSGNLIKIKSLLKEDDADMENTVIKMFQTINYMIECLVSKWNKISISDMQAVADSMIRMRDYALRSIHTLAPDKYKKYDFCDLVTQLERMSAQMVYISKYVSERNPKDNSWIHKFKKEYEWLYHCYLKKDFSTSVTFWENNRLYVARAFKPSALEKLSKTYGGLAIHYYALMMRLRQLASRTVALSI